MGTLFFFNFYSNSVFYECKLHYGAILVELKWRVQKNYV